MAVTLFNNWRTGQEFILIDISLRDWCCFSAAFMGFGIVIAWAE